MRRATRIRVTPPSGDERLQPMVSTIQKLIRQAEPKVAYSVRHFGARGDGRDDTQAVQNAIDAAQRAGFSEVRLDGGRYVVKTLRFDCNNIRFMGPGALIQHASIPDDGSTFLSLAGGSDTTVNGALLDSIYGMGAQPVRTSVPGSMENVVFCNIEFVANANQTRAFHMTGFTRACSIQMCRFTGFTGQTVTLNGSWSCSLLFNLLEGASSLGHGFALGMIGNGERSGSLVVNAISVLGNEITGHSIGCEHNFGAGGLYGGNIFEGNVDGFQSLSVTGCLFGGNYLELNTGDNAQLGGTNGSDFIEGWVIGPNYWNNSSGGGNNIKVQSAERCNFDYQMFGGSRTQWYIFTDGDLVRDCTFIVPDLSSTYISNAATDVWTGFNDFRSIDGRLFRHVANGNYTTDHRDFARLIVKDAGGAGETITIDSQANKPCRRHSKIRIANLGGGTLTVAVTTDAMQLAGAAAGNRTIANMGYFEAELMLATADGDATNTWLCSGQGVT